EPPTLQRVPLDRLGAVSSPVAGPQSASGPPGRCPCSAVQLRCTRTDRTARAPGPLHPPPRPRPSTPTDSAAAWNTGRTSCSEDGCYSDLRGTHSTAGAPRSTSGRQFSRCRSPVSIGSSWPLPLFGCSTPVHPNRPHCGRSCSSSSSSSSSSLDSDGSLGRVELSDGGIDEDGGCEDSVDGGGGGTYSNCPIFLCRSNFSILRPWW